MTAEAQRGQFDYDAELSRYHPRLLAAMDVRPDDHVLDIGCGSGLTTRAAAESAVSGSALGVDVSAERLAAARRLSEQEGLLNVRFERADAQTHLFPAEGFSLGISRFGTMFFSDPEAAFTNIARALRPGARLVQLVWQDRRHQEWDVVVRRTLATGRTAPDTGGEPFSLADPAAVERLLTGTGFTDVQAIDVREPVYYGPDADAACDAVRSLWLTRHLLAEIGPARAEQALDRLRASLASRQTADGVWFDSRAWIVTARRP
ncbi:methyltransferase domain-containing protein [Kribbella sp. NBC_01484]|uniref:class I SAM-dependent methyltransferase n=1 Tax=Kribbella sp. NBC_01484 TaxID=2903579 RepID=UPI002E33CF96|nr:methyltransferase domain-containing protein [Kribbella sp. NBC_01484]